MIDRLISSYGSHLFTGDLDPRVLPNLPVSICSVLIRNEIHGGGGGGVKDSVTRFGYDPRYQGHFSRPTSYLLRSTPRYNHRTTPDISVSERTE